MLLKRNLKGYLPISFKVIENFSFVVFSHLDSSVFKEPFFDKGVQDQKNNKGQLKSVLINLEQEIETINNLPVIPLTGFIVHLSRCGSTLLSQMLAQSPKVRVVAEPQSINELLSSNLSKNKKILYLRSLIKTLSQKLLKKEKYFFTKFSSYSLESFSIIREAFPNTPFVFLYREPSEIMVSIINRPAGWMKMKFTDNNITESFFGYTEKEIQLMSNEEYAGKILKKMLQVVIPHLGENGVAIDYYNLINSFAINIIPFFGLKVSENEILKMIKRSSYYSKTKDKNVLFTSDYKEKKKQITSSIKEAADSLVLPHIILLRKKL